ncbi:hypothetical protein NUSPORA_01098 [Nucleospora cyclopteri]
MIFIINAQNTALLDKFLQTTNSEFIDFEVKDDMLVITLIAHDTSVLTTIIVFEDFIKISKVESTEITEGSDRNTIKYEGEFNKTCSNQINHTAILFNKFYRDEMIDLIVETTEKQLKLTYHFKNNVKTVVKHNLCKINKFEIEFKTEKSVEIDPIFFNNILKRTKNELIEIEIKNNGFEIKDLNCRIKIESNNETNTIESLESAIKSPDSEDNFSDIEFNSTNEEERKFKIKMNTKNLKKLFHYTNFNECYMCIEKPCNIIKFIFKKQNIIIESYLPNYY